MTIKPQSAKAKGRRLAKETKDILHKHAPDLRLGDILVTGISSPGTDLKLSPAAQEIYPFAIECKFVEKISIWTCYKQAVSHLASIPEDSPWTVPILVFRRSKSKPMVMLDFEDFVKLVT